MKFSTFSSQKGISLIESMIALSVLGISLMALLLLMESAVHQGAFSRYNTAAGAVAQGKLEELRVTFSRELETGTDSSDLTAGSHGPETVTLSSPMNSNMGDHVFLVSWDVAISGGGKTITQTVEPDVENVRQNNSLVITTVFAP